MQAIADQLDYAFSKTKQIISTESGTGDLSLALNDVWYNFFMPLVGESIIPEMYIAKTSILGYMVK